VTHDARHSRSPQQVCPSAQSAAVVQLPGAPASGDAASSAPPSLKPASGSAGRSTQPMPGTQTSLEAHRSSRGVSRHTDATHDGTTHGVLEVQSASLAQPGGGHVGSVPSTHVGDTQRPPAHVSPGEQLTPPHALVMMTVTRKLPENCTCTRRVAISENPRRSDTATTWLPGARPAKLAMARGREKTSRDVTFDERTVSSSTLTSTVVNSTPGT